MLNKSAVALESTGARVPKGYITTLVCTLYMGMILASYGVVFNTV